MNVEQYNLFSSLQKEKKILRGVVKELRKYRNEDGEWERELVVMYEDTEVTILSKEIVNYLFSRTPVTLVGEDIKFVITDVYAETGVVFGSMKVADKIRKEPTLKKLYSKTALSGTIVHLTDAGAYIDVGNGVQGLLRNNDYSPSGRAVSEDYRKFDEITVVYSHTTQHNTIIFEPYRKTVSTSVVCEFKEGIIYGGKVVDIFPDKVFVRLAKRRDCLCGVPPEIGFLNEGDTVRVRIQKVMQCKGGLKIRGKIIDRIKEKGEI